MGIMETAVATELATTLASRQGVIEALLGDWERTFSQAQHGVTTVYVVVG
jgi:hypothetical protein